MIERDPRYVAFRDSSAVTGLVMEVGLGRGDLAVEVMQEDRVALYKNYENNPAAVTVFDARYPTRDPKHRIAEEDFDGSTRERVKFDTGIIDTLEGSSDASYTNAWRWAQELGRRVKPGGKIIIEYRADLAREHLLRERMEGLFGEAEVEFIRTGRMRTTRHIVSYTVPR